MQDIIIHNLVSPAVLFFVLGVVAALTKSDLKFPSALSESLSIYLLIAIGLKGGIELSEHSWSALARPVTGTLILGIFIPILTFLVSKWLRLDNKNAIALAATYGSVSIVTYGAAIAFLQQAEIPYESFMNAMVVLLESPAIVVSFLLLGLLEAKKKETKYRVPKYNIGIVAGWQKGSGIDLHLMKEILFGKSILLLLGALCVGLIAGKAAIPTVKPLFMDLYQGVLVIFLLGMGMAAGERLTDLKQYGVKLIAMAITLPLVNGVIGCLIGYWCGLSTGGTVLMGVLGASASYIAAPAALKHSVPEANPSIYLGMSLGVTFPFNLIIGLPVYIQIAQWLHQ